MLAQLWNRKLYQLSRRHHRSSICGCQIRTSNRSLSFLNSVFGGESSKTASSNHNTFHATVNYKPAHVYRVVADVERYSEFVPWCKKSKIVEHVSQVEKLADLTVGFYGISEETFRSRVLLSPVNSVTATASSDIYSKSPLKRLKNIWTFEPLGENSTRVTMNLEFEFHDPVYARLTSLFINRISQLAISSFEKRCNEVKEDDESLQKIDVDVSASELAKCKNEASEVRGADTVSSLASCAHFAEEEVEILSREFSKITRQTGGRLGKEELSMWLGEPAEIISSVIFEAMDVDHNGTLILREFIAGLSLIARGTPEEKRFTWFRHRSNEMIARVELENAIMATMTVRAALLKVLSPSSSSVLFLETPRAAATRLVEPVFRDGHHNNQALDRLFASM